MGATNFTTTEQGRTAREAFRTACEVARDEYGNRGYTGTVAEKDSFKIVRKLDGESTLDAIERCEDDDDHFTNDKFKPAGCIDNGDCTFTFFGTASC